MKQKIGDQLDALGLEVDLEDGYRIIEAHVQVTSAPTDDDCQETSKASAYEHPVGVVYVPSPVVLQVVTVHKECDQLSDEQRQRVINWLTANGIEPKNVAPGDLTIETRMHGDEKGRSFIGFTQYVGEGDSSRVFDWRQKGALTVKRLVEQTVELAPDPQWQGWDAWRNEIETQQRASR